MLKFDFQVPYNNNIIFAQIAFFSLKVIFDVFSIKWFILFIAINSFLKKPDLKILDLLMIID